MKVLLTATVYSHICQFHKPLAEVLHAHGWEVHCAARDNLAVKNGLKMDFIDKAYNVPLARSPLSPNNLRAFFQLRRIIREEKYDVIHCNTPVGGIVTRLAALGARRHGTKVFYTAHGFHFYQGSPKKNWLVYYPIELFFSRITDKLITITHEDHALAAEKFHCEVAHIHGVGVNEDRYHPVSREEQLRLREELGFTPEQKIILNVGELLPNKNQKMAIRAISRVVKCCPDAVLVLAGNGPEQENLEAEIAACGAAEHVKMIGYCTCLEKYQAIADLLIACSHREGLPLNLLEAMLTANPVVATKNRGHRELIHNGTTGYLVEKNDDQAMAERIVELLTDDAKRRRFGEDARSYARSYAFEPVKKELEAIYFPDGVNGEKE